MVCLGSKITSYGKSIRELEQSINKNCPLVKSINCSLQKNNISMLRKDLLKHMYGVLQHMDVKYG